MKIKLLSFFILIMISFGVSALEVAQKKLSFSGQNSLHGPYIGELEFRPNADGFSVIRVMTYDQFRFQGLAVQEVWTGVAHYNASIDSLIINYKINLADFLLSAEGESRNVSDFSTDLTVTQNISLKDAKLTFASFKRSQDEVFNEDYTGIEAAGSRPLWENKRIRLESKSHESSTLFKLVSHLVELRVFKWFHAQELPKMYAEKEDFKNKRQYFIYDFTDEDFYQEHKDLLRVVNKVPDRISLIESLQRRNAYAYTLKEKSQHFENDMKQFHLNEYGLFSGAVFDSKGKFLEYSIDGDGALWSGMYLGAEAMRFNVTHDPEALENVKKSINGLMLLMDITESNKEFARNVGKYREGRIWDRNLHRGGTSHQDKIWLSSGNNDMFKGLIHGFIWAYLTLPLDDVQLREKLKIHMQRIPELEVAQKIQNKASAYGLRALATQSAEDLEAFRNSFIKEHRLEVLFNIEGNMHMGGIVDWSGANLGMVGVITDLLIAKALGEEELYEISKKDLALSWKDLAGTKRDFLTIATYAFAVKDGFNIKKANEIGDGYSRGELEKLWQKELTLALTSLKEIPVFRSQFNTSFNFSLRRDWCLSWWPRLPWKSIKDREAPEYHYQSVDSYPLFEGLGLGSNFIWKDQAFGYLGGSDKFNKAAGADYLYSYWMARFAGLIGDSQ